jgi:hypothetical protein
VSAAGRALLSLILITWYPLNFAAELLKTLPSIAWRGPIAGIELLGHGLVAALCVAAALSLWNERPDGRSFASAALIFGALAAVQNLYWSVLPSSTIPGDELPLAILATAHSALWLMYLRRASGDSSRSSSGSLGLMPGLEDRR